MISFYLAVILNANGDIVKTFSDGIYKTPGECYAITKWPVDKDSQERYKCIKATGQFVNFEVIEKVQK